MLIRNLGSSQAPDPKTRPEAVSGDFLGLQSDSNLVEAIGKIHHGQTVEQSIYWTVKWELAYDRWSRNAF